MKIKREIKIGIVACLAVFLFIYGFNFLKGRDIFMQQRTFYAVYKQVDGLTPANPVIINGLKVGKVNTVKFHPDGSGKVIVEFVVTNNFKIPKKTTAKIVNSDIMGSKAIQLIWSDSLDLTDPKIVLLKEGDTLSSAIERGLMEEVNMQFLPIKKKAENIMLSLDSVLVVIQYIFNEETRANLKHSFESIEATIKNFEHTSLMIDTLVASQRTRFAAIIGNVESISTNIKNNNSKLNNVINNFSNISDSLAKANIVRTIDHTNKSLQNFSSIIEKINRGEGSLGMLVNNDSLYIQLEGSSQQLKFLLEDMRLHPNRYVHFSVFGRKDKEKTTKK